MIIKIYDFKAGLLAMENFPIVDAFFSKPYTKLFATALGVSFAHLYTDIQKYRSLPSNDRSKAYPKLHIFINSKLINYSILSVSAAVILLALNICHPALSYPYNWSTLQNMLYFSLGRFSFVLCIAMVIMVLINGHLTIFKNFATSKLIMACGKSVFMIGLTYPVLFSLITNT